MPTVALKKTSLDTLQDDVLEVLKLSGCLERISKGGRVILKPNLVTDKPEYIQLGANTSPEVLEALLKILSDVGCRIGIGESETGTPVKGRRLEPTWKLMGYDILAERYGAELLNFTNLERRTVTLETCSEIELELPADILECDLLIDIPKIKTHKYAVLTCAMKNLFGLLPEPRRIVYHRWLPQIIAGLANLLHPRTICLVDGLVGMEGNGPLYGKPVDLKTLLAGQNSWAVDRTVCDLIHIPVNKVRYIQIADRLDISKDVEIGVAGDTLESCRRPFEPVEFNLYRSFEKKLMESHLVNWITSEWFQRHLSSRIGGLTKSLRGGGYSWYLDDK